MYILEHGYKMSLNSYFNFSLWWIEKHYLKFIVCQAWKSFLILVCSFCVYYFLDNTGCRLLIIHMQKKLHLIFFKCSLLGNGNTLVWQFYRYDSPGRDVLRRKINICSQFPNFSNAKSDTDGISYSLGVKIILLSHNLFFRVCSNA